MLPDLIACTVSLWIKPKTNLSSLIFIVSCRGAILDKLIEMIKKKNSAKNKRVAKMAAQSCSCLVLN